MLSPAVPRKAQVLPYTLYVLQWAAIALLMMSLGTREWYENKWFSWLFLLATTALWAPHIRHGIRRWWFFYVGGLFAYEVLRSDADSFLRFSVHMEYPIRFDKLLFAGEEPVVWLQDRMFSPSHLGIIDLLATQMHWSFFIVPHALAAVTYIWRRDQFARYVIMMLAIEYIALVVFFLVPTAPPWLAAEYRDTEPVHRVIDFVGRSLNAGAYNALAAAQAEPNSVAAMPSLHMAITFACYLWIRRCAPTFAPLFLLYSVLMAISLVYLGEHYVSDLLAGAVIALIVDQLLQRWSDRVAARGQVAREHVPSGRLGRSLEGHGD